MFGGLLGETVVLLGCRKAREGAFLGKPERSSGSDCMAMNLEGGLFD